MLDALISIGVNPNQEITRAVSDGLKQIRIERFEERQAKKRHARPGKAHLEGDENVDKTHEVTVHTCIDQTELDEVMRKAERVRDLMKEANSLIGEMASKEISLTLQLKS